MKKRRAMPMGMISLLAVFAVSTLAMLSVMTLLSARSERQLAERTAATCRQYYACDAACTALLARLQAGERPEQAPLQEQENGSLRFSFSLAIDEYRQLCCSGILEPNGALQVLERRTCESGAWAPDQYWKLYEQQEDAR